MRRLFMTLGMVLLAACGDSTGPGSITGTYELSTINGRGLPFTVYSEPGYRYDVTDGSITLRNDGSFRDITAILEVVNGQNFPDTITLDGTYRVDGDIITFRPDNDPAGEYSMRLNGRRLTQDVDDPDFGRLVIVYER